MAIEDRDSAEELAVTGIVGLDTILRGGFPRNHLYLIEGTPGSGKTTLALQFLLEGVRRGECCLYVTLSETERELRAVAKSHGWSLDQITVSDDRISIPDCVGGGSAERNSPTNRARKNFATGS